MFTSPFDEKKSRASRKKSEKNACGLTLVDYLCSESYTMANVMLTLEDS